MSESTQESERIEALRRYEILDTPPDEAFDRLTRLAARVFGVPTALISFVDENRQWFKSRVGLSATETPRDISFCTHAIQQDGVMVVANAFEDERFQGNPLVVGDPHIRFYAGAQLRSQQGHNLGTFCVIDQSPRDFDAEDSQTLRDFAALSMDQLELRLAGQKMHEELKSKERALVDLEAVLGAIDYGIMFMDSDLRARVINDAFCRMWNVPRDFAQGRPSFFEMIEFLKGTGIYDVSDSEWDDYVQTRHSMLLEADGERRVSQRSDGKTLEYRCLALPDGGRMLAYFDITEHTRLLNLRDEFLSTVSHELRTPLTSIKGSLGLLKSTMTDDLPEKAQRLVQIGQENCDRLVRLINDILDIEKMESGGATYAFQTIDLSEFLQQAVEANRGYASEHNAELFIEPSSPCFLVRADHDRLMQVLANLLSNAVKFSPSGGRVTVKTDRIGTSVRISVSDNGPGIASESQSVIFEKFTQVDASDSRSKGGTGLGLSIAKAIVEQHGGSIGLESEPGAGSCFYFDLPLLSPVEGVTGSSKESQPTAVTNRARILICEDEPDIANLIKLMIQNAGYDARIAHDAQSARALLEQEDYAALTLDLGLPDTDGLSFIRELRGGKRTRDLPIVVISARAQRPAQHLNGDAVNVMNWLQKPIDEIDLKEALASAMRRTSTTQPRILHVEDDMGVVEIVTSVLEDIGTVVAAKSLQEAYELATREKFDLVILDLALPDGKGENFLPMLHSTLNRAVPVMVFSASEPPSQMSDSIMAALVKSRASNDDLLAVIKSAIDSPEVRGQGVA